MADFFDEKDIEPSDDFFDMDDIEQVEPEFSLDEAPKEGAPSQLEAAGRGLAQGATMGFGDELGAVALTPIEILSQKINKLIPGSPENVDEQLREQGFGGLEEPGIADTYKELRDTARGADEASREAHPVTSTTADIAGGVLPGLLTGGGAAAANIAKSLGKEAVEGALKQSVKEGAKLGAKYGAASGLGYSDAEDLGGMAADTAIGGGLGAVGGAALPVLAKGVKTAGSSVKKGAENLFDALPGSETAKASYQYGKQGKKVAQETLDEDTMNIAKNILKNIEADKKANNLTDMKDKLDALGYKVDTKKAIDEAIDDLKKLTKEDFLDVQNKDLLPKIQEIAGYDAQGAKMAAQAEKQAIKKIVESQGKANQAVIGGEKRLAKIAEETGDEIQTISNVNKSMDDLDIPLDTSKGKLGGVSGKMKTPEGEEYVQKVIKDTTEYQPEVSKILGPDGQPIIKTVDKGSGKISAIVGNIEDKVKLNLENMTISEVEALRKQLNLVNKIAQAQGATSDPILQRAQKLAGTLKELTDEAIAKGGDTNLISSRKRFSDIFSAEEMLGIDKSFSARRDINTMRKATALGDKIAFEKGFKNRQEGELADSLLGEKIVSKETKEQLNLLKKLNRIVGRESSDDNISRVGIFGRIVSGIPNLAGRTAKKAGDINSKVTSPVTDVMDALNKMSKAQLEKISTSLSSSESKGAQHFGKQLTDAMSQEGQAQSQAIWAISQSPAFRELLKREIPALEQDMRNDLGMEDSVSTQDSAMAPMVNEPERSPAGEMEISEPEIVEEPTIEPSSFFKPQTSDIDMNVDQNMMNLIESISKELGYDDMVISSGRRGVDKTMQILEQRKKKYGLDNFGEDQALIDKLLLRGDTPDNIEYANRGDVNTVLRENFPEKADELIEKFRQVRSNFGGLQSKHLQGKKVDIPYSYFVDKYGKKEGTAKAKEMVQALKDAGLKVLDESKTGRHGVIDIETTDDMRSPSQEAPEKPKIDLQSLLQGYADQEPVMEESASEEEILDVEDAIDSVNQQQSSGDGTPVNQLDALLGKIAKLKVSEESKDEIESDAVNMSGFSDGVRLKELLRKIAQLK